MNKVLKVILILIILFIIGLAGAVLLDTNKVLSFEEPIIAREISGDENETIYSVGLYGFGVSREKVDLYIFGQKVFTKEFEVNTSDVITGIYTFKGKIVEKNGVHLILTPTEDAYINTLSDKVSVTVIEDEYVLGEEIYVTYDGRVMESYPTQIEVLSVQKEKDYYENIVDVGFDYTYLQAANDDVFVSVIEIYGNITDENFSPPYTHSDSDVNGMELVDIGNSPDIYAGIYDKLASSNRTFNTDEVDKFIENVDNNIPDFIRIITYSGNDKGMDTMQIRDVSFEGDNVFKTAYAYISTLEHTGNGTMVKYNEYSKMVKIPEDATGVYLVTTKGFVLLEPKQSVDEYFRMEAAYSENAIINNDYDFNYLIDVLKVKELSSKEIVNNNEFIVKYDGFEDATVLYDNNIMSFENMLKSDATKVQEFYSKVQKDFANGIVFAYLGNDTKIYSYDEYRVKIEEVDEKIKIVIEAKI